MNSIIPRWHRLVRLAAGTTGLIFSAMIGSCADNTAAPKSSRGTSLLSLLVNSAPGVSFLGIDTSLIDGLTFSEIYYEADNRAGNDTITTHWAGFGDGADAIMIAGAQVNGISMAGDGLSNIIQTRQNHEAISPGTFVRWDVQSNHGMIFHDSVLLPRRFGITNITPYSDQHAAQGITISTVNSVPGGDAVVTLRYDPARTLFAGGDTSGVVPGAVPLPRLSLHLIVDDNGMIQIPPAELQDLPRNKVYMLLVHRFNYETKPLASGSRAGMIAVVSEMVPVFLRA